MNFVMWLIAECRKVTVGARFACRLAMLFGVVGMPAFAAGDLPRISEDEALEQLFAGRKVLRLEIVLAPKELRKLSSDNWQDGKRPSALATVHEDSRVYTNVAVHLKGGAGSARPVDDNPGLTLNFSKSAPGQSFHGLAKLSLNNAVQDPSYLNDKICRELFNRAGVPTPRAGFTTVELNGRRLGLHVLTEGFNKQFLRHYFTNVHGNLYQTHGNQEITDKLDINSGDEAASDGGLRELAKAVAEPDPKTRWKKLQQTLDLDRFLSFMAMEIMLCHWDGYCMNQNNYRVFHDLGSDKIVFIAHGMDQMFGTGTMLLGGDKSSAECPLYPEWHGAVAEAVMSTSTGRKMYLERLGQLYTNLFQTEVLLKRVDELAGVVRGGLVEIDSARAARYQRQVDNLKSHIRARARFVAEQLAAAGKPREAQGPIRPSGWTTRAQNGHVRFDMAATGSRSNLLHISMALGQGAGSWRTRIRLEPGRYRFEGEIRVSGVKVDQDAPGALFRISGAHNRSALAGTMKWQASSFEFQVGTVREVELVCELRALSGDAWFDPGTLRVVPAD